MKATWLIYFDGVFWDTAYEHTEYEAINAARAIHHPPEEGDALYGTDTHTLITATKLEF